MEGLWEKQPCSTADRHIVESDSADDSNKAAGLASNTGACHDATPLSPAGRQNPMGGPFPKPPGQGVPGSWTLEEDAAIIALHDRGEKWEDIGRHLQGRSGTACHFRYVFLRHRPEWNEEWKDQVAVWYQRCKSKLWAQVANKVCLSERDVEALAWQLGPWEMARRAAITSCEQ